VTRAPTANPVQAFLFFAALFCATFEKVNWQVGLTIRLADLLSFLFIAVFAVNRVRASDRRLPRTATVLGVFLAGFLLVYLIGFYNLDTAQAATQFAKGLFTFLIHFLFLVCGVALLARESEAFFWRALGWFFAGTAFNALYGFFQLGAAVGGIDLDHAVLSPLTGGAASINIYGAVRGTNVYRPNALTGDPNHLGIVLILPLMVLTPLYLRLEPQHRLRVPLAWLLGFLLLIDLATLSRSGLVGLVAGTLVLLLAYRGFVFTKRLLYPLAGVALAVLAVAAVRLHFVATVLRSRTHTSSKGASVHFGVYDFIPQVLHAHPLFGLGFNTFSVYYEFITGKTDWGPHSFYVALIVETGLVGTAVFAGFLWYLFARLQVARRIGRLLAAKQDPVAARVRPLAWGMTAALVGTLAANAFYLTMTFDYFYAFAMLVVATPLVFVRRLGRPAD
jgi:O-Antigen ligase